MSKAKIKEIDDQYRLAEFKSLRKEMNQLNDLATTMVNLSLVSLLGMIGILSQLETISFILFPIPFFVLIPSLFIIISRFQGIHRLSGYIRVFLEPHGLHYENRYLKYLSKVKSKRRIAFTYRGTIFWLYCGLGLLSIGLFISKGFISWYHLLFYLSPIPFYVYAYRLIHQNWRQTYDKYWKEVKEEEKREVVDLSSPDC